MGHIDRVDKVVVIMFIEFGRRVQETPAAALHYFVRDTLAVRWRGWLTGHFLCAERFRCVSFGSSHVRSRTPSQRDHPEFDGSYIEFRINCTV